MEIDQSVLESLPLPQRQKLCRQLRQEQVRRYNEFQGKGDLPNTKNKKGQNVKFENKATLLDAVSSFDDREVSTLLSKGTDPNTTTASGLTPLHKCCMEDNQSVAELLLSYNAFCNQLDDDWWTPLHYASELDRADLVHLLLNAGADAASLDVDGNFPLDHAPEGSHTRQYLKENLKQNGITNEHLKEMRYQSMRNMLNDVKALVATGGDVNLPSQSGITLLHIACANGYGEVTRILLDSGANVNAQDEDGWTPLHAAAKYQQVRMVKLLLKNKADPLIVNEHGKMAVKIAGSEVIRKLITRAMARLQKQQAAVEKEDEEDEKESGPQKIISKIMRPRHSSLSKKEELYEARTRFAKHKQEEAVPKVPPKPLRKPQTVGVDDDEEDENPYEAISMAWRRPQESESQKIMPTKTMTDDLASLSEISEKILINNLQERYKADRVYTYVGDILIAVNPFKFLPIYGRQISKDYQATQNVSALPPHIYGMAQRAFHNLTTTKRPQCCVISGESGAGKTESSKYFVQHLLSIAQSEESSLNSKIQQVNPLLEAFGNAQTKMNDNSSRFGKFLEILFTEDGFVQGARISEYLLEKSRVAYQGQEERNFHIFYLLFAGLTPEERDKYALETADKYRFLKNGNSSTESLMTTDNRDKFHKLRECLKFIGFTNDDVDNLFLSLSAVLHLGNIEFQAAGNNDAAKLTNPPLARKVAAMLQVPAGELATAFTAEITITRGEQLKIERSVTQARDCCDALAKALYGRLFSWIVNGINQLIQPLEDSGPSVEIGVLDIFGFENFPRNSFEQLCINLANEQLQFFFNEHIFSLENDDCLEEGVSMQEIEFSNNKAVVDLFLQKPMGILSILDEESRFPKATDQSLATKLHQGPGVASPDIYLTPKDGGTSFAVMHYAGKIVYDVSRILDKNRDTLPNSIMFTLKTSNSLLIRELFQARIRRTGSLAPSARQQKSRKAPEGTRDAFEFFRRKKSRHSRIRKSKMQRPVIGTEKKGPTTVAFHFKNSLADLMAKFKASEPHFVRCIKPNMNKMGGLFDMDYVRAQLRYTGMLETVRIRQQGFPLRVEFAEFVERYFSLALCTLPQDSNLMTPLQKCCKLLQKIGLTDYKIGKTKLFFRFFHVEKLNALTKQYEDRVLLAESVVRGWLERKKFRRNLERKRHQDKFIKKFLADIDAAGKSVAAAICEQRFHDSAGELDSVSSVPDTPGAAKEETVAYPDTTEKPQVNSRTVKREYSNDLLRNEEVRKSIEALDKILDEFDDPGPESMHSNGLPPPLPCRNNPVLREQRGGPLPPPPPAPGQMGQLRPNINGQAHTYPTGNVNQELYGKFRTKQRPPVPKRSPDTRLSISSQSSSQGDSKENMHDLTPESGYQTDYNSSEFELVPGALNRTQGLPDNMYSRFLPGNSSPYGSVRSENVYGAQLPENPYITSGNWKMYDSTLPPPGERNIRQNGQHEGIHYGGSVGHSGSGSISGASMSSSSHSTGFMHVPQDNVYETELPGSRAMSDSGFSTYSAGSLGGDIYERTLPGSDTRSVSSRGSTVGTENEYDMSLPTQGPGGDIYETSLPGSSPMKRAAPPVAPKGRRASGQSVTTISSTSSGVPYSPSMGLPPPPNFPPPEFNDLPPPPPELLPPPPDEGKFAPPKPNKPHVRRSSNGALPPPPPVSSVPPPPVHMPGPPPPPAVGGGPPPPPPIGGSPHRWQGTSPPASGPTPPPPPPISTIPRRPPANVGAPSPPPPPPGSVPGTPRRQVLSPPPPRVPMSPGPPTLNKPSSLPASPRFDSGSPPPPPGLPQAPSVNLTPPPPTINGKPPPPAPAPKPSANNMPANTMNSQNNSVQDEIEDGNNSMDGQNVTSLPGYQPVPEGCPQWKRALLEKKNHELLDKAKGELEAARAEEARWKDVPKWKKDLIMEKEKKSAQERAPSEAERRRQEEEQARLNAMPEWKRNLVLQKKQ